MGAKSAIKLRKRGIAFKCDLCGRKLMTRDALMAHQRTAHNVNSKRRGRPQLASKPVTPAKAQVKVMEKETAVLHAEPLKGLVTKVEFECPKCFKAFPTFFTALKHIQKYHCFNGQDIIVQPHNINFIQPMRVEFCLKCMGKVKSISKHVCKVPPNNTTKGPQLFVCAACEEWFPNMKALDSHVVGSHDDHVESMFFPTHSEFTKWKAEVEQQMNIGYSSPEQYDSKLHYHCNFKNDVRDKGNTQYTCPSTMVVQEFTKGVQVHFYHQHYNHSTPGYKLSQKYKKYSISSFMKRAEDYNNLAQLKQDDADLYMQFKALMEGIIVDAAKINIATLKILVGKALEITAILTNYDEELDDISTVASKPKPGMSDVEITKLLEEPLTKRRVTEALATKSGNVLDVSLAKRKKIEVQTNIVGIPSDRHVTIDRDEVAELSSPKIVNSFSLAEPHVTSRPIRSIAEKSSKESEIEENKSKANGDETPSSFNDSYKDFVVKNFPSMESVASRTRSKPVVKTRIGQFKANLTKIDDKPKLLTTPTRIVEEKTKLVPKLSKIVENTPKLIPRNTKAVEENVKLGSRMAKIVQDSSKLVTEKAKTMDDTSKSGLRTAGIVVESPRLVTGMAKNVEDKTNAPKVINKTSNKTEIPIVDRKQIKSDNETPKTKQIKKVHTPKAKTVSRNYSVSSTASFDKPKVDFEYEVKEQADDCNILILKF